MKKSKIIKRSLEYFLIRAFMLLGRIMPRRPGFRVFGLMGMAASRIFRKEKEMAVENLAIAFPRAPLVIRQSMSRAMFRAMAKNCFEFIKLENTSTERILSLVERIDGLEDFEEAYNRGKGLISVTGHIGCWELMAAYFSKRGYPVTVVARKLWLKRLNERILKIRSSLGVRSVDRDSNPRLLIDILQRKEVLGVLMDQSTRVGGIYVPFFDKPAHTPSGVAKVACITGAMIIPIAIYLNQNLKHDIKILEPIDPYSVEGTKDQRIEKLTIMCSKAIETLIRIDPKQWVWFHDRWRPRKGTELRYAAAN